MTVNSTKTRMLICCTKTFSTVEPLSLLSNYHPSFPIMKNRVYKECTIICDVDFLEESLSCVSHLEFLVLTPQYSQNDCFQGEIN